jgi:hypothetical protein
VFVAGTDTVVPAPAAHAPDVSDCPDAAGTHSDTDEANATFVVTAKKPRANHMHRRTTPPPPFDMGRGYECVMRAASGELPIFAVQLEGTA